MRESANHKFISIRLQSIETGKQALSLTPVAGSDSSCGSCGKPAIPVQGHEQGGVALGVRNNVARRGQTEQRVGARPAAAVPADAVRRGQQGGAAAEASPGAAHSARAEGRPAGSPPAAATARSCAHLQVCFAHCRAWRRCWQCEGRSIQGDLASA